MSSQRIKLQRIVGTHFIAMACMMAPALAESSGVAAAADVAVTDIQIVPEVLMQEDSGTVKIGITNSGSDSVSISRAEILSGDLQVINYQTYDSV